MVITATGAIDAGIDRSVTKMKGREQLMIPFLMAFFAMGGTVYGMAEETIPFTQGMLLRVVILTLSYIVAVIYVMRYAKRVRSNPELSLVANKTEENKKHFLEKKGKQTISEFTGKHKVILGTFAATFGIMIWGVASAGWWMDEMSIFFLASSILVAVVGGLSEEEFVSQFVEGAKDLLGVVLVPGIARGIGTVMDNGQWTDHRNYPELG